MAQGQLPVREDRGKGRGRLEIRRYSLKQPTCTDWHQSGAYKRRAM